MIQTSTKPNTNITISTSTNQINFNTTAEKEKLAGLSNYDDTDIKASIATKANSADVYKIEITNSPASCSLKSR